MSIYGLMEGVGSNAVYEESSTITWILTLFILY